MKEDYLYSVAIHFHGELSDFLPADKKGRPFEHPFFGKPTVKELIEGLGVPHTEIAVILVNQEAVGFDFHIHDRDHVDVYPQLARQHLTFIADVHLGKLARYLRLLGFDTVYENDMSDERIIEIAEKEHRVILTRDLGILKKKRVIHGYFIRHTEPKKQLKEVVNRFKLKEAISPFTRCLECNEKLIQVEKDTIEEHLLPDTKRYFETFFQCPNCTRIYWEGSHVDRMDQLINFVCS